MLGARVASLEASEESFAELRRDAAALEARVSQTAAFLDELAPAEATEASSRTLLANALAAQLAYASELSGFPALPRDLTEAKAQAAIDHAELVESAYAALADAEPSLPTVSVSSFDHVHLLDLVPAAGAPVSGTTELRAFVNQIESILAESASGRSELSSALSAGFNCSITTQAAGERVDLVVANRQALLERLFAVQPPSGEADEAASLLRAALQHSVEADIHYRDGFFATGSSGCPLPPNSSFTAASKSDGLASAAKKRFVAAFNPLAQSVGRRTWSAGEI
jgi:hypothetical protein